MLQAPKNSHFVFKNIETINAKVHFAKATGDFLDLRPILKLNFLATLSLEQYYITVITDT